MSDECRCAQDGGDWCYQRALADAGDDRERVQFIERLNQSRRASRVPFHVVDPVVLAKVASVLARVDPQGHTDSA